MVQVKMEEQQDVLDQHLLDQASTSRQFAADVPTHTEEDRRLSTSSDATSAESCSSSLVLLQKSKSMKRSDDILATAGISPLNLHSLPKKQRRSYGKNKIVKTVRNLSSEFSTSLGVSAIEIVPLDDPNSNSSQEITKKKSDDLDILINELKEKFENANREERIKILSLKPSSWNIQDTANYFGVTRYHVAQALKLKEKKEFCRSQNQLELNIVFQKN